MAGLRCVLDVLYCVAGDVVEHVLVWVVFVGVLLVVWCCAESSEVFTVLYLYAGGSVGFDEDDLAVEGDVVDAWYSAC